MYRTLLAVLAAALTLAPAASALSELSVPALVGEEERPGTGQWIVGFYEMPDDVQAGGFYLGEPVVSVTPELGFITIAPLDFGLFQVKAGLDDNIRYVEADWNEHQLFLTPNDYFTNHVANYGYWKIGANLAHDRTLGTTAVKDGHVDSGRNAGHEDLQGSRFLAGWDFRNNDGSPDDERGCSWHGSHTTGTAAATINNGLGFPGLSQSTVLTVKIFGGGKCFAGTTTSLANALKYVGDQGSHVSSNSWGGGAYSQAIHDAIGYSVGKGVLFIAAAGNDGCTNCIGAPWLSQEANVVIVSATDSNDVIASFSSTGPQVDISAPGVSIGSSASGTNGYVYMSGTSQATPHVTGVAMLVKSLNPTMTASQISSRLTSTAVDLGAAGKDNLYGWGRLNADGAVV